MYIMDSIDPGIFNHDVENNILLVIGLFIIIAICAYVTIKLINKKIEK